MKCMEISYDDLSESAKERYLETFCVEESDINTDMPIAYVEGDDEEYHGQ